MEEEKRENEQGLMAIETLLGLTMFIIVFFVIFFLMNSIRVQGRVQGALTKTAMEISNTSIFGEKLSYVGAGAGGGEVLNTYLGLRGFFNGVSTGDLDQGSTFIEMVNAYNNPGSVRVIAQKRLKYYLQDINGSTSYLNNSSIVGGENGIRVIGCEYESKGDRHMKLTVSYQFKLFSLPWIGEIGIPMEQTVTTYIW